MEPLEFDVKRALITSPNAELQWHVIRNELFKKYEKEYNDKKSFTTILHRKLQKMSDIEKKSLGHQNVFYFIPKVNLTRVSEAIDRETAHRRFDEIWSSFTPEQRKRELQFLLRERIQPYLILQNFLAQIAPILEEQATSLITKIKNPTEETKNKYSEAKRKEILRISQDALSYSQRIKAEHTREKEMTVDEETFRNRFKLLKEFMDKVVEPKYSGMFNEAILDLMQKAINEQDNQEGRKH